MYYCSALRSLVLTTCLESRYSSQSTGSPVQRARFNNLSCINSLISTSTNGQRRYLTFTDLTGAWLSNTYLSKSINHITRIVFEGNLIPRHLLEIRDKTLAVVVLIRPYFHIARRRFGDFQF